MPRIFVLVGLTGRLDNNNIGHKGAKRLASVLPQLSNLTHLRCVSIEMCTGCTHRWFWFVWRVGSSAEEGKRASTLHAVLCVMGGGGRWKLYPRGFFMTESSDVCSNDRHPDRTFASGAFRRHACLRLTIHGVSLLLPFSSSFSHASLKGNEVGADGKQTICDALPSTGVTVLLCG